MCIFKLNKVSGSFKEFMLWKCAPPDHMLTDQQMAFSMSPIAWTMNLYINKKVIIITSPLY